MANNYFQDMLDEIKKLCEGKKYDQAHAKILAELNLPYVPIMIENQLHIYLKKVLAHWTPAKKINANGKYDDAHVIEQLIANNDGDNNNDFEMIFLLEEMNLRKYLPEITNLLENARKDSYIKTFLLEILAKQAIDQEFKVCKNSQEFFVNPSKMVSCFEKDSYILVRKFLQQNFEANNYRMYEIALEIWKWYNIFLFPQECRKKELINAWALTIVIYVLKLQKVNINLDKLLAQYHVKEDDVNSLMQDLEKIKGANHGN